MVKCVHKFREKCGHQHDSPCPVQSLDSPDRGVLAYHVLDSMVSISESMESGSFVNVESSVPHPPPSP